MYLKLIPHISFVAKSRVFIVEWQTFSLLLFYLLGREWNCHCMVKFSNRHNTWIRYALTMYANECKNFLYSSNASNFQGFFFFCAKTLYTYIVHRKFSDPFYYRITHPRKNATQRRKLFKFLSENLRRTEKKTKFW